MKMTSETLDVLKNYAFHNGNLLINPGSLVHTKNESVTVYSAYESPEEFDEQIAIYDLNQFLQALNLFEDPEIEVDSGYVRIFSSTVQGKELFYRMSQPKLLSTPTSKIPDMEFAVTTKLTRKDLNALLHAAAVLKNERIVFVNIDGNLVAKTSDKQANKAGSNFQTVISENVNELPDDFELAFDLTQFKILPLDYEIGFNLSENSIAHLKSLDSSYKLEYWLCSQ